ncbi:DUF445 family protein [Dehalobacter sp. DCM]|uniref:DUF445 domain-containing protein n=1 Tax=Dehalobacter sp. DCM TaxID=2907827 RepID=UPI003081513B|nr:DUF445 family protein [Dehalobacter sp. DCM]
MDWTTVMSIASGPVIGAVIGYITNYIAVKMLFRPLKPIKVGAWTLPFTPGIFPKRKEQLAKALGNAVGNNLLTNKDVTALFMSDAITQTVGEEICRTLYTEDHNHTINKIFSASLLSETDDQEKLAPSYNQIKDQIELMISERIKSSLLRLNVGNVIAQEVGQIIRQKTQGTMLAVMVNDKLIGALTTPIGEHVETFINANGSQMIRTIVSDELASIGNQPIGSLMKQTGISQDLLKGTIEKVYVGFVRNKLGEFIQQFDLAGVVEAKVKGMDVLEIEKLVLSVMKNELRAIVNLGALIGFIIGLANSFI